MDCKDLMVGDWVICNHYQDKPFTKQFGVADFAKGEYEFCEPISLTEEILVKNGFEKQGDLYQYHINAGNGYTRIDIIDLQDGLWSYDIDVYDKFADAHKIHHDDDCFLKLHQLQHLLRLVGIEKEITI